MIGLCACGQEEAGTGDANTESMVQFGETTVQQMDEIVKQGAIEQYASQPEIYAGLLGWQDALDDIGTFEGTNGGTAVVTDEEMIVTVNVLGSSHNATVEIIFDATTGGYAGITTNVKYSLGEIMVKAAMNTVIGMGTVFAVLILISLIISCFTLISKLETNKQKPAASTTASVQSDPVVTQIAQKEELSDDTELVAVIAAAIAAYEGSGSTDGFVVRSIRKSNKSKWQNA
ncbi:MAG: OadG family protein [Lachnospiraceae bacterium]|nr:OadG family protein [Lachnospiraceae bacterium]